MGRGRVGAGPEGSGSARTSSSASASGSAQRPSHQAGQLHGSRRGPRFSERVLLGGLVVRSGSPRSELKFNGQLCPSGDGRMPRIPSCWREPACALQLAPRACNLPAWVGVSWGSHLVGFFFLPLCR